MDKLCFNRPIVTGLPSIGQGSQASKPKDGAQGQSFQDILKDTISSQENITFTKHAAQRVLQRGIEISPSSMERLSQGMRLAEAKGLNDTLILVDSTAFVVNVKSNKVITTVQNDELMGNVFTNIDGTVII